mgnify:CR=1 FL=1
MKPIINDYTFYKIMNENLPDLSYIGSTCNFIQRKYLHKYNCIKPNSKKHNLKLYKTIRENGGWDKWQMVIIDKLEQATLTDARIKEEKLRQEYNGNMNMKKAYISVEDIQEYQKDYRQANKKDIVEYNKIYHLKNKNIINEKHKNYRQVNKEIIEEKRSEKMTCDCGSIFRKDSVFKHNKTLKHKNYCKSINLSDT